MGKQQIEYKYLQKIPISLFFNSIYQHKLNFEQTKRQTIHLQDAEDEVNGSYCLKLIIFFANRNGHDYDDRQRDLQNKPSLYELLPYYVGHIDVVDASFDILADERDNGFEKVNNNRDDVDYYYLFVDLFEVLILRHEGLEGRQKEISNRKNDVQYQYNILKSMTNLNSFNIDQMGLYLAWFELDWL